MQEVLFVEHVFHNVHLCMFVCNQVPETNHFLIYHDLLSYLQFTMGIVTQN